MLIPTTSAKRDYEKSGFRLSYQMEIEENPQFSASHMRRYRFLHGRWILGSQSRSLVLFIEKRNDFQQFLSTLLYALFLTLAFVNPLDLVQIANRDGIFRLVFVVLGLYALFVRICPGTGSTAVSPWQWRWINRHCNC